MTRVAELFAAATMVLEDVHPVATEGQRRGTAPDRARALVGHLRAGMATLDAILAEITACLGVAP
jgi:hypothetical protein